MRQRHLLSALALLLLPTGWVVAQEAEDVPAPNLEAADEEAMPDDIDIVFEPTFFRNTDIRGSLPRAGHYVMPYSGPNLSIWDLDVYTDDGFDVIDMRSLTLFEERFTNDIAIYMPDFPALLRVDWDRARFYGEPLAGLAGESSRTRLKWQAEVRPWTRWKATARFENRNLRIPALVRGGSINYDVQDFGGSVAIPLGPGTLDVSASSVALRNRVNNEIGSHTNQYRASYQTTLSRRLAVGGSLAWANISQPGLPSSDLFTGMARAVYQPSSNLWLEGRLQYRDIDLGPTVNGYVSESASGLARATWRPWRPVRLRAGVERTGYQRLNAVQSAVEEPHWTRFFVGADYRGPSSLRASIEYELRTLEHLAPSAVPFAFDNRSLFLDEQHRVDARVSAMVGNGGLAYGFWRYRQASSEARNVGHWFNSIGVGTSYPVLPRLTVAGDIFYRSLAADEPFFAGLDTDSLVAHVGLAYALGSRWRFSTDYHHVQSYYGLDADENQFAASVSADLGRGHALRFGYNREDYDNGVFPGLDYEMDVVNLSYLGSF